MGNDDRLRGTDNSREIEEQIKKERERKGPKMED